MNDFGREPNKARNSRRPDARRSGKGQTDRSPDIEVTDCVTVAEAAVQLRCCTKTVRSRIKEGKLEAYRHGQLAGAIARDPEHEACRALLARGIVGTLMMYSTATARSCSSGRPAASAHGGARDHKRHRDQVSNLVS
jgi:excisionase family DNA binding protein